jgi:hypothetical protein
MPDCHFTDFDITIRGETPPFSVTCSYAGRDAEGAFQSTADDRYWRELLDLLGDVDNPPGQALMAEAGGELFDELMQDEVRDLWIRARGDLEQGAVAGLRLRLAARPPMVAALPWEALYDPHRGLPLAADARTPLVRVERLYRQVGPSRPLETKLPLKLLLAVPDDPSGAIDAAAEIDAMQRTLTDIGPELLTLSLLQGRFDVLDLREALTATQADILHVIAHGRPDGILLWQDGEPRLVQAAALRMTLQRTPAVKLALLNACLAGQQADETAFSAVGPQLLQAGLPAVIAMQFEIADDDAVALARHLYAELLHPPCPGSIDMALANARSSLYALDPDSFAFGAPILWLNASHGNIFTLPAHVQRSLARRRRASAPPSVQTASPKPLPSTERLDEAALAQWLIRNEAEVKGLNRPASAQWPILLQDWRRWWETAEGGLRQWRGMMANADSIPASILSAKRGEILDAQVAATQLTEKLRQLAADASADGATSPPTE